MVDKKVLWKIPVYCIVAGFISFHLNVLLISKLALVKIYDGTVTSDTSRVMILYALGLFTTVLLGGFLFFKNMTRKEVFLSASIMVAVNILLLSIQWILKSGTGFTAGIMLYTAEIYEWSMFIPLMLMKVIDNVWICSLVGCFVPYLFIPFGRKE